MVVELTVVDHKECWVVLEIGAHTRGVDHNIDTQRLKQIRGPDTAELQNAGSVHGARCEYDVLGRHKFGMSPAVTADDFNTGGDIPLKLYCSAVMTD